MLCQSSAAVLPANRETALVVRIWAGVISFSPQTQGGFSPARANAYPGGDATTGCLRSGALGRDRTDYIPVTSGAFCLLNFKGGNHAKYSGRKAAALILPPECFSSSLQSLAPGFLWPPAICQKYSTLDPTCSASFSRSSWVVECKNCFMSMITTLARC